MPSAICSYQVRIAWPIVSVSYGIVEATASLTPSRLIQLTDTEDNRNSRRKRVVRWVRGQFWKNRGAWGSRGSS